MDLIIEYLGGCCPVQGEGTIHGVPFYFRSRGAGWVMAIGNDPVGIVCGDPGWVRRRQYEDGERSAIIPLVEAHSIIQRCAEEWCEEMAIHSCNLCDHLESPLKSDEAKYPEDGPDGPLYSIPYGDGESDEV